MANKIWVPKAVDVSDVYTLTIGGTWAANDTITITVDGQDLVLTLGSTAITAADVADKLHRAINARDRTDNLEDDESRNVGGAEIPQLAELSAKVASTVVTLTGPAGKPVTMTSAKTSTSGTVTQAQTQSATGKHFWNNADNWAAGSVPAANDDVWFYDTNVDCLYGLPTTLVLDSIHVYMSFTGRIGLPPVNRDNPNKTYPEYRQRYVQVQNNVGGTTEYIVGEGVGSGPRLVNIDTSAATTACLLNVYGTGVRLSQDQYVVNFKHGTTGGVTCTIDAGTAAINHEAGDSGDIDTVQIGDSESNPPDVWIGDGLSNTDLALTQYGGRCVVDAGVLSCRVFAGTCSLRKGWAAGSGTLWIQPGAKVRLFDATNGSTISQVRIAGTLDATDMEGSGTLQNVDVFPGAVIDDPAKRLTFSGGFVVLGGAADSIRYTAQNVTLTPS